MQAPRTVIDAGGRTQARQARPGRPFVKEIESRIEKSRRGDWRKRLRVEIRDPS